MILDLFAGPGGWSEGLRILGAADLGMENDAVACATRAAAGHATIRADVAEYARVPFRGRVEGLIASPPCQDFSLAGKRLGIEGARGGLMVQVPLWVTAVRPRWVACEQVPPALEWFSRFEYEFHSLGYRTWCGILNAADYGVPQTRRRAFLLASLDRKPEPPRATHAERPQPTLFGRELLPWVSMAEAIGWDGSAEVGFPRADDRGASLDGYRERDWRSCDEPAFALTEKARSWVVRTNRDQRPDGSRQTRSMDEPAPALSAKAGGQWRLAEPATTIGGDPRISPRVHHDDGIQGRSAVMLDDVRDGVPITAEQPIKLTIGQALAFQSFRTDYPVQGSMTKRFQQVGNAVPPRLAAHVLRQFVGGEVPA